MPEFSYQAFSAESHSFAYVLDRRRIVLVRFCGKISKMLWKNFQGHSLVNRVRQFSIGIGMPISQVVFSFSILSLTPHSHALSLFLFTVFFDCFQGHNYLWPFLFFFGVPRLAEIFSILSFLRVLVSYSGCERWWWRKGWKYFRFWEDDLIGQKTDVVKKKKKEKEGGVRNGSGR